VRPIPSDPGDFPERILDRETPEQAAQDYHFDGPDFGYRFRLEDESGGVYFARFALVEVESPDGKKIRFVSKTLHHGLWRAGGVKGPGEISTIEGLARELGWERDPKILLDAWEGEESLDEASSRQKQARKAAKQ
jgi:hypothetical protein